MEVVADADGLTGCVGSAAVLELPDRLGLTAGLSVALAGRTRRRSRVDGGAVVRDLVVMLVDGGDALTDLGVLRDQPDLFGHICSDATAARVIDAIGADELEAIRAARAAARARAWQLGARPERVVLDIDASLVTSHSEKEGAAPTYERGFGFHPMLCFLAETREAPAAILRPGNAGSNTALDKICVLTEALRQLPDAVLARATAPDAREAERILVRCDAAGATHDLLDGCRKLGVRFSVGFPIEMPLRAAILKLKPWRWRAAVEADGRRRQGAWVAELPRRDLPAGWPPGSRLLVRRERPHPGAQLAFTDHEGHRFQLVLTDQPGDPRDLELVHRARGDAENRVRAAKDCGMRNPPSKPSATTRSRNLYVNYRTSHQIRESADRLLDPEQTDVDGVVESRAGTVSVFNGAPPTIRLLDDEDAEVAAVSGWIGERVGEGLAAQELGVFVRSDAEIDRAKRAVETANLPFAVLGERVRPKQGTVTVSTMHLAKGVEFRAVVVMACDDEVIPSQERIETIADDADLEDIYKTERHLLSVACNGQAASTQRS